MRKHSRLLPPALLILLGLVVLSPLYRASGVLPLHSHVHWDTMIRHYPRLAYATDAVRHAGMLPLWDPFQDLGFPTIIDPETQLWSPLTWLVMLTTGYSLLMLQMQLVLMFLVAGLGAYAAGRTLGLRPPIAWMVGASYMLSGYFVTSAGLLGTHATMACFPWALACVARAMGADSPRRMIGWMALAGVVLGQCSVGGHPTTALVAATNLALAGLLWPHARRHWKQRAGGVALMAAISALVSAPQIVGVLWLGEEFDSLQPYTLQLAEADALGARGLLGFVLPGLPLFAERFHPDTHVAHLGCYAGVLALLGLGIALSRRRWTPMLLFLLAAGGLNLLAAMGGATPWRQVLYYFLPGMQAPHHAAMDFRGFAILYGLLAAASGWNRLEASLRTRAGVPVEWRRAVNALLGVLLALGAMVLLFAPGELFAKEFAAGRAAAAQLAEELLAQAVTIALLALVLALVPRLRLRSAAAAGLCLFVAFDMAGAVKRTWPLLADPYDMQGYRFYTSLEGFRPGEFRPEQFTQFNDSPGGWTGIILHEVELNAYNPPMNLSRPGDPRTREELQKHFGEYLPQRAAVVYSEDVKTTAGVKLLELAPNGLTWRVEAHAPATLRVLTTWTHGWTARVNDGGPAQVTRSRAGRLFLEADVPAGGSTVEFRFRPPWLSAAIAALWAGYLIALGLVLIAFWEDRRRRSAAQAGDG